MRMRITIMQMKTNFAGLSLLFYNRENQRKEKLDVRLEEKNLAKNIFRLAGYDNR